MRDTEIAWAAGFFDGEGHVKFRRKASAFQIQVGQKERETLERFQVAIGGFGRINFAPKTCLSDPNYWQLNISNQADVRAVYFCLLPYLSTPKRNQFLAAFEAWNARIDQRGEGARRREQHRRETGYYDALRASGWRGWRVA